MFYIFERKRTIGSLFGEAIILYYGRRILESRVTVTRTFTLTRRWGAARGIPPPYSMLYKGIIYMEIKGNKILFAVAAIPPSHSITPPTLRDRTKQLRDPTLRDLTKTARWYEFNQRAKRGGGRGGVVFLEDDIYWDETKKTQGGENRGMMMMMMTLYIFIKKKKLLILRVIYR